MIAKPNNSYLYSEELCARLEEEATLAADARACTGVLGIHPMSKDIKLDNFSVTFHGAELIVDSRVELSCGRRYGLIGVNGSGKSSFLAVLGNCITVDKMTEPDSHSFLSKSCAARSTIT